MQNRTLLQSLNRKAPLAAAIAVLLSGCASWREPVDFSKQRAEIKAPEVAIPVQNPDPISDLGIESEGLDAFMLKPVQSSASLPDLQVNNLVRFRSDGFV
ncbi:MAG: hypothetical protein HC848_02020 [Limnobacter sp.]|nr:hypothetical protein [Limnobacter sp.]